MNIKIGQGFKYFDRFGYEHYGVIVSDFPDKMRFFPVVPCNEGHQILRSFEDLNARDEDKDNVRLEFCPPPFEELGTYNDSIEGRISNSMAIANLSRVMFISKEIFERECEILDGGKVIDERDMHRIWNHNLGRQFEMEKKYVDRSNIFISLRDNDEKDDKGIDLGF